jgi:hypothetical protein
MLPDQYLYRGDGIFELVCRCEAIVAGDISLGRARVEEGNSWMETRLVIRPRPRDPKPNQSLPKAQPYLPTYLPHIFLASLLEGLGFWFSTYLPAYLPTYLPTSLLPSILASLPTYPALCLPASISSEIWTVGFSGATAQGRFARVSSSRLLLSSPGPKQALRIP